VRRLLPLLLLVVVPAPSAALADGCPPSMCGTTAFAIPGSRTIFVRPHGQSGPLQAFDSITGAHRFSLPSGLVSADSWTFVSAAASKAKRTTVVRFDARTRRMRPGWSLRGRWNIGGVSADGRRVALTQYRGRTTVLKVGPREHALRGMFEVEAFSPGGGRVYLIHWRDNGYDLQQLDLSSRILSPTRLDEPDEKMSGTAVSAIATRDGRWLLTLYAKGDGHSFVHALNLGTGLAHCIDIPLTGGLFMLGMTALTLSPDEKSLYLASPYLGRVTTVDLQKLELRRVTRFQGPSESGVDASIGPTAAITPNGRMLAFSGAGSLWLLDTAYGVVRRALGGGPAIRGVGFRPDGRSLLAIRGPSPAISFDAATGRTMR
jgi:hypothetical protein